MDTSAYDAAGGFGTYEYLNTLEWKTPISPGGRVPASPKRIAGSAHLCVIARPGEARLALRRRALRRGTGGARSVEGRKLAARDSCAGRDTGQPRGVGSSGSRVPAPQGVCGAREGKADAGQERRLRVPSVGWPGRMRAQWSRAIRLELSRARGGCSCHERSVRKPRYNNYVL